MNDKKRIRLDALMVSRGLVDNIEKAHALIMAGQVLAGDKLLEKPGIVLSQDTELRLRGKTDHYVSRGAFKLLHAIQYFKINLKDKICLDVGASTGGFTQVCLENGANKVYAIDVGHSQLHFSLTKNPRVISIEKLNFRFADPKVISDPIDFVCIDASFISLKNILEPAYLFLKGDGCCVALIKPQHEVNKEQVGDGGVVRDVALHQGVCEDLTQFAESIGFSVVGLIESPIKGTAGNIEFLIYLKKI